MDTLYITIGPPSVGKTTYTKKNLPLANRVSMDDLRMMLYGVSFDPRRESIIRAVSLPLLETVLSNSYVNREDVVWDATSISRKVRKPIIELGKANHFQPVALYFNTNSTTAHVRNKLRPNPVPDDVIDKFFQITQRPTHDEGFIQIIEVRSDGTTSDRPN